MESGARGRAMSSSSSDEDEEEAQRRIAMASCVMSGEQVKEAAAAPSLKKKRRKSPDDGDEPEAAAPAATKGPNRHLVDRLDALISSSFACADGVWDSANAANIVTSHRGSSLRFFSSSSVELPHRPLWAERAAHDSELTCTDAAEAERSAAEKVERKAARKAERKAERKAARKAERKMKQGTT